MYLVIWISQAVTVEDRNGTSLGEYSLSVNATVGDMKKELCAKLKKPKYNPERQWYTVDTAQGTALKKDEMALKEFAKEGKLKLILKDLGFQISWSTVFMVEYFGTRRERLLFFYFIFSTLTFCHF